MDVRSACVRHGYHIQMLVKRYGYKNILLKSKFYRVGISLHRLVKVISVWVYAKKFILSKEVLMPYLR